MAHDILGLGGPDSTVKNLESADAVPLDTADEAARRRKRMSEGADELTPGPTGVGGGATDIDSAGGKGTDID